VPDVAHIEMNQLRGTPVATRLTLVAAAAILAILTAGATPARSGVPYELVSRFTTYYPPGQPRVINIRRAAHLLVRAQSASEARGLGGALRHGGVEEVP
jgi:hypothetical protein